MTALALVRDEIDVLVDWQLTQRGDVYPRQMIEILPVDAWSGAAYFEGGQWGGWNHKRFESPPWYWGDVPLWRL